PDVAAGATVDTHANLVDICATVRDTLPPGRQDDTGTGQGVSLWEQMDIGLDRPAFSEYHDGGSITGSFCVRVGDTKLVHHEGERPELFDLATDPDELTDVSDDPDRQHDLQVGYEALGTLVDTSAANAAAFASQEELIARLGGRSSLANFLRFNHTPVPE
ncbi:MAG: choline-sulfatase, partial [Actinomycetota bacterium]|nr:choline-sulfatase [Actinomycetota bacterium]